MVSVLKLKADSFIKGLDKLSEAFDLLEGDDNRQEGITKLRELGSLIIEMADWVESLSEQEFLQLREKNW
jgi:hypothetical protein